MVEMRNARLLNFPDEMSVRQARERYFKDNGFGEDGGYSSKWVPLKFGWLTFYLYNSKARRRAVPLHDLHHIATGYDTDPAGEAEVAIWELAAGTYDKWFALLINLPALVYGYLLWPSRAFAAWRRGRMGHSLYQREFDEDLLHLTVGELRAMTRV